ncbi:MAG TPA: heavy metal-binding domain-containing protein [Thermotogales bacterium]|nr:heavy metal-binding domain-containing protein [Thermotogales bacterium]
MILSTTDKIPGMKVKEILGLVMGNTIKARHIGRDIAAAFKNMIGGEIMGYTEMLTEARNEAIKRMIDEAEKLNADAIVGIRLATSQIMSGAAEMLAYGTAVKLEKDGEG